MKRPIGATFSSFDEEDEDATTSATTTSLPASLYPLQRALSESIRRPQLYHSEPQEQPQDEQLRETDQLYVSSQFVEAHEHDPHGWNARSITSPTQANSGTHTPSLASPITTTTTTSTSTPALSPPSNQILTQEMILQRPPAAPKKRFPSLGRTASATTSPNPDQNDEEDDDEEPAASSYYYYLDGRGKSPDSVFRPLRMELDDTEDNYANNNGILRKLHPLLSMPSNLGMDEEEEQQQQELLETPPHHQYPAHRRYHSVDVLSSIEFPDLDRLVSSPLASHRVLVDPEQVLAPRPRPKRLFLQHDDDNDWQESNSSLSTVASTNSPTSPTTQPVLFRCGSMDSSAGTARLAPRLTRRGGYHKRHGSTNTLPTLISRSSSMTSTLARGYHAGYHPSLASSTSSSSLDPAAVFSSSSTSPLFLPILNHDEQKETNKKGQPPQVQWNPATPTTRTTSSLC